MEGFSKEEKYNNDLKQIRSLPQGADSEKEHKREKAKKFRMEVMFDNACIMKKAFESIRLRPDQTQEELLEELEKHSSYLAHPQMVKGFVKKLIINIANIKKVFNDENIPENLRITAETIFERLSKGQKAKKLIYLDVTNELAPILFVTDPEDFKLIDSRDNIGGFYKSIFYINDIAGNFVFPLIVINGNNREWQVITHENGHAENEIIQRSRQSLNSIYFWLNFNSINTKESEELIKEYFRLKESNSFIDIGKIIENWKPLLFKLLDMAKDEILADFAGPSLDLSHTNNLRKRDGVL